MALRPFSFDVVTLDEQGRETERRRARAEHFVERLGKRAILELVQIPGGTFAMGAPQSEPDSGDAERPQRGVTVPALYLGKYAVTIEQWRAVMGASPAAMKILDRRFKVSGRQPVVRVSCDDAEAFCANYRGRLAAIIACRARPNGNMRAVLARPRPFLHSVRPSHGRW